MTSPDHPDFKRRNVLTTGGNLQPQVHCRERRGHHGRMEIVGQDPTDRAKPGGKRHLIYDARGVPLASPQEAVCSGV